MATFLEEEEFTHPQLPQILAGSGFRYASLAQVDTFGRAGIPVLDLNVLQWKGMDGTTIPCTPKNALFGYSPDLKQLVSAPSFQKLCELGKPLIFTWEEFGWEPHEKPAYLTSPEKYRKFAEESPVEFVTLKEYMEKYGKNPKETVYLKMDAWDKLLTWGLGGDQLRILDRKVEGLLLAAERFDAIASTLGGKSKQNELEKAWKELMTSQSHDVGLCEYSRWQGDRFAPLDRIEDYHNFAWGVIGYQALDAAQKQGQEVLDDSLGHIVSRIGSASEKRGEMAVTVFNPNGWDRSSLALTGRIYPIPGKVKDIVVKDRTGRILPAQILKSDKDREGNLVVAEMAFLAEQVPSVGYDTYYLEFAPNPAPVAATDLRIDEAGLAMENAHVKVTLDPATGAVSSLIDKKTGQEMLARGQGVFPAFRGKPNPEAYIKKRYVKQVPEIPVQYDSANSKAEIHWTDKGPLRATLRAHHKWPFLEFETNVTLDAQLPYVEVVSRVLADLPPLPDQLDEKGRFPSDIQEGYWLSFRPGFQVESLLRDFPLGIEATENSAFHALTFLDLVGKGTGLLVLHAGNQWFNRDNQGRISNLLMREWESRWTGEYGWPRYSEYRHALMPHRGDLSHAERMRISAQFTQRLIPVLGPPRSGSLPKRKGFIMVEPANVQLSAFRKKEKAGFELRVVETQGQEAASTVELALPVAGAVETNLLGDKVAEVSRSGNKLSFKTQPWKIRTFELT
jgi:alpha-mannosidase